MTPAESVLLMREINEALEARELRAELVVEPKRNFIEIDGYEVAWRVERHREDPWHEDLPPGVTVGLVHVAGPTRWQNIRVECVADAVARIEEHLVERARERLAEWRDERNRAYRAERLGRLRDQIRAAFTALPEAPRRQSQRELGALMREYATWGGALEDLGRDGL